MMASQNDIFNILRHPEGRNLDVETITGWKCQIRDSDVKIVGILAEYLDIAKPAGGAASDAGGFDAVRFGYSNVSGLVGVNLQRSKDGETISINFELADFVSKVLDELPNAVTDAIMDEKERRSYS